jgi:hypothetical protein
VYIFWLTGGFFDVTLVEKSGKCRYGTHPVPVRWAAGEEWGSPAAGGRAGKPPGTPARSPDPAGICPAQGKECIPSQGKEYSVAGP